MTSDELSVKLADVRRGVSEERRQIDVDLGRRQALSDELSAERARVSSEESDQDLYRRCRDFLRQVLEGTQQSIETTFSEFTTAGISSVFGDDKAFRFQFVPTAHGVAVKVHVLKPSPYADGEMIEISPKDAEGGGMLDVISVGLRAGMLELYTPRQDGPLLLDEVDKYIADDEMVQAMGEFLRQYSHGSGRQVIIITHKAGLMAYGDKNFDFRPGPGLTCVVDTSDND
ncbi:MAG: hypothetical protein WC072_07720 [Methanoregulaceae archaeon]